MHDRGFKSEALVIYYQSKPSYTRHEGVGNLTFIKPPNPTSSKAGLEVASLSLSRRETGASGCFSPRGQRGCTHLARPAGGPRGGPGAVRGHRAEMRAEEGGKCFVPTEEATLRNPQRDQEHLTRFSALLLQILLPVYFVVKTLRSGDVEYTFVLCAGINLTRTET